MSLEWLWHAPPGVMLGMWAASLGAQIATAKEEWRPGNRLRYTFWTLLAFVAVLTNGAALK